LNFTAGADHIRTITSAQVGQGGAMFSFTSTIVLQNEHLKSYAGIINHNLVQYRLDMEELPLNHS